VDRFLLELADGEGPAAVVCHSLLIRSILRRHCPDDGDLARGLIPNCSVLSIDVGRDGDGDGALRLANPALAFNPTE
jgi:hypothetical protein